MKLFPAHVLSASIALLVVAFSQAQTATPAAEPGRTNNRGPEEPELKFKLPPPAPLTPEQALKALKLPPGFKAELVASEPMIETPVAISFDDQGRVYVCEMRGYMHDVEAKGEDQPLGRISRLEDTDGDGKMDKATVFVDKLVMPRGVMAMGDGAVVGVPPNLIYYRDTNGDGVADQQETISDSYGKAGGQPEHMANTPIWAMDNWIWVSNFTQRFRYQGGKFVTDNAPGARGQWGLTQDDFGRLFFNYNSDLLRTDLFPGQYYARNPNVATKTALNFKVLQSQATWPSVPTPGVNRGYQDNQLRPDGTLATATATCGATIYRGDLFPAEFQGNAFIPEPSGLLVKRVVLSEGAGEVSAKNAYEGSEFLTSSDERFRPVNTATGPDGALYIVDMARGVIQHRFFLTHYLIANIKDRKLETPLGLGRIFRIVPDGTKPATVKLPKESVAIVPLLGHANGAVRDAAQRVLVERADASVTDALKKLTAEGPTPLARLHALWTLEGLGALPLAPDVVLGRLADPDPKVRATAIRLADRTLVLELVKLVNDPSPEVRLQLAFSLSAQPGPEVEQALVTLLNTGGSKLLGEAVATGLRGRELEFIETLLKNPATKAEAIDQSGVLPLLAGCVVKDRRASRVARLIELVAAEPAGSPRQLELLAAMAGPAQKKGAPAPKLFYLESAPPALAALLSADNAKAKSYVAALDKRLAWPGKPGVPPPPKIVPLTADEQVLFEKGKTVYNSLCIACHQAGGVGLDGLAPPLLDSEWILGKPDIAARIILHGIGGPIDVGGTTWRLEMPPLPQLTDEDIASVLTYARREWEHNASPVKPADVAKVRAQHKDRTRSWTAEELKPAKAD
jgi:mono/diheme cytochrome c family protein/glucose/arabinose dehydrogenase